MPELLKYPIYDANTTSDDDDDSEDWDAEYPVLMNRVESDNDNNSEKEENKVDQNTMEAIKKFMNMTSRFLSGRKYDIFIDSTYEDDYVDDENNKNPTNSSINPKS